MKEAGSNIEFLVGGLVGGWTKVNLMSNPTFVMLG